MIFYGKVRQRFVSIDNFLAAEDHVIGADVDEAAHSALVASFENVARSVDVYRIRAPRLEHLFP